MHPGPNSGRRCDMTEFNGDDVRDEHATKQLRENVDSVNQNEIVRRSGVRDDRPHRPQNPSWASVSTWRLISSTV